MKMSENGGGLIKALEKWAQKVSSGYRDVEVRDLSTSFRDGMAFCAIIHHYRPDLINFDSLLKENIYENNSLAFSVAEKQLGVPALLDAEDMVKYSHPDRLSIITYLSQLRNCFENQNKVSKKPELKRIVGNSAGPPAKVVSPPPLAKRHEVCQSCRHRVFILERLIVDGKLYHTTCFRCHKCQALLNPGAYVEGDEPGLYECTTCLIEDETMEAPQENSCLSVDAASEKEPHQIPIIPQEDIRSDKESITFAKSNLWDPQSPSDLSPPTPDSRERSGSSVSVKDKINVFEKNLSKSPLQSPVLSRPPIPQVRQSLLLSTPKMDDGNAAKLEEVISPQVNPFSAKSGSESPRVSMRNSELFSPVREINGKNLFLAKSGSESPKVSMKRSELSSTLQEINGKNLIPAKTGSESPRMSTKSSELSSPTQEINGKSLFPAKSGSESPRVPRDIFKSSLSPLKLNLPSSIRKEALSISPINSTTLPYSRSLSLLRPSRSDLKVRDLEVGLDTKSQSDPKVTRRSSLESSLDANKEDKTETAPFSRTHSSQEIRDDSKAAPTTYTPVYKGLYSPTNLSSKLTFRHSYIDPRSSDKLENTEENKLSKIAGSFVSEEYSCVGSGSSEGSEKVEEKLDKRANCKKDAHFTITFPPPAVSIEENKSESTTEGKEEEYPDDLNPFGDVSEGGIVEEYPDDLNPFGDDNEEPKVIDDYDESKNPFASDDDNEDSSKVSESKTPFDSFCSNVSSPSGSLKGTLKKRRAPPPPRLSDVFPPKELDSGVESSSPSLSRKNFQTSSPKVRKNKQAPPPPSTPPQDPAANTKKGKESDNMKLRMQQQQPRKKKRPAPSVPVQLRKDMKKIPLKEIVREMKEIEEKQREYERQGREIELLIRDRDKEEEPSVEEEEYILQLFELVNQKNALFRRQAELMYIKRSQRLEELQHQVEKEIRQLMEKPESEKTEEDRQREEELTMELIDIVDQRNSIIDSIEMDRRRELEEDHSVQEQLEIKNGDLPITAEIKQKSGKAKKKKKKEEGKKKKHLFSKLKH